MSWPSRIAPSRIAPSLIAPSRIALVLLTSLVVTGATAAEPVTACMNAAAAAERNWTVPTDLIGAIGRVESGRLDHMAGRLVAWPWTVNVNGGGYYFGSRADAVTFVRAMQARGIRLIDVGCFQIDLFYHPAAFATLEQAFDPAANADYAARFLTDLRNRTGSWPAAIAGYHSGVAEEGASYRRKVLNQWKRSAGLAGVADVSTIRDAVGGQAGPDRFVVLMSAAARAIHVIGPSGR